MLELAYLGPEGSHSHAAVGKLLAHPEFSQWSFSPTPMGNLRSLVKAVANNNTPFALLPIENALEGSVVETLYGLLVDHQSPRVIAELALPIAHSLISATPNPAKITDVISHPQALAQCQATLQKIYGDALACHAATSTSEAVSKLAKNPNTWAAIGTTAAAQQYGAHVIHNNLSDVATNQTRFWFVASPQATLPNNVSLTQTKDNTKTTLCIGLNERPGVLVDVLLVLKAYGLTMTRIESRPARKQLGDYLFFIDVAADLHHPDHDRVRMYLEADSRYLAVSSAYTNLGALT